MSAALASPHGRVFRGSEMLGPGVLTRRQLRGPSWRRLLRDVYADARLPVTHGLYVAAARLIIPPQAVIAGRSAGWLYGGDELVAAADPVEVLVADAHRFGPIAGLRVHTTRQLAHRDIDDRDGLRSTTPLRTALDLARTAPNLAEAVTALDLLLARGVVSMARLEQAAAAWPRARGSAQARRAVRLADGRSESPQESRMRVGLVLRGVTGLVPQYVVRHDGRFVARLDLGDPEARLGVEYDGLWHWEARQLGRDRRRLNALAAAGWRVVHATAADLHHLDDFAGAVTAARHDQLGLVVTRSSRSATATPS